MSECKFCKIIESKEVRATEELIFENDGFIVITDKYRKTSVGAICLIIPKVHVRNIFELSDKNSNVLFSTIKLVGKSMQAAYNCNGIRIWTAVNKEAGQSIFHCHIHVVPCKSIFDRFIASFPGVYDFKRRLFYFGNNQLNNKEHFELAEKLRIEIKTRS